MRTGAGHRQPHSLVVVVTGVPGSGKTTLATGLAGLLDLPRLSLDTVKESLHLALPATHTSGDPAARQQLRLASEAVLWALLADCGTNAVLDIWVDPERDRDRVTHHLSEGHHHVVEILCRVPADIAVQRYQARPRGGAHLPADPSTLDRIRRAAADLGPLGVGRAIEVNAAAPVDLSSLATRVLAIVRTDTDETRNDHRRPGVGRLSH